MEKFAEGVALVAIILMASALLFGVAYFLGWLTMIALGVFGIKTSVWPAFAVYFIVSALFGVSKTKSK